MLKKLSLSDICINTVLALLTIVCLAPVLNTVAISFSDKTEAALGNVFLWPVGLNFAPYEALWKEKQFFQSFMNSVLRVLIGGAINVTLCILTAYPLSKPDAAFKARKIYLWLVVFTMLFSGGLVPTFLLIARLRIIDSIWALVLPGAVPVFSVIILMNYFRTIPASLEEAALVDGANPFVIMQRIHVPLALPAIATITLFSVVNHWNSFFDGRIYINTPAKMPLQTYIQGLTAQVNYQSFSSLTPQEIMRQLSLSTLTFTSAKVVVSMVPILAIYPLLQRYFLTGIVMGAVKE
jgi:ABC-type glycerol-3-phosphate transport system permease component